MPRIRVALLAAIALLLALVWWTDSAGGDPVVPDSARSDPVIPGSAGTDPTEGASDSVHYTLPGVNVHALPPASADPRADLITPTQIRRTAATADDAFRVVQTLPGVAASDFSASFLVRGAESDETLVRYDGFDLPEPYHIPYWGGAISVLSPDVVQSMRLLRGGLPARYGRGLSGALEIDSPRERPEGPRYLVGAGPTQLRALLSGPTHDGGSYRFGVRQGLLAAIGRIHRLDRGASVVPDFQDAIGEARFRPGEGQEITLLALGAQERIHYDMPYDENDLRGTVRNLTLGASWSVGDPDRIRQRLVVSADQSCKDQVLGTSGRDVSGTRALRARLEGELGLGAGKALEWGAAGEYEDGWLVLDGIRGSLTGAGYQESVEHVVTGGAVRRRVEGYVSARAPAGPRTAVTAGVNVSRDVYSWGLRRDGAPLPGTSGFAFLSPRVSVLTHLSREATAWMSLGIMRQPSALNRIERESLPLGRNREAAETAAGFSASTGGVTLRTEGYLRREQGVGMPIQDVTAQPALPFTLDRGSSRGLETSVRTPTWRLGDVTAGYTLSRAVWNTPAGDVRRSLDQPNAAALSVNVRPRAGWNLNALARYHTGAPYTPTVWIRSAPSGSWTRGFGPFLSARYPDYFRLDLRLSRPLAFGPEGGEVYVELINATGRRNVHQYTYVGEGLVAPPRREVIELFPRMPAAGFRLSF